MRIGLREELLCLPTARGIKAGVRGPFTSLLRIPALLHHGNPHDLLEREQGLTPFHAPERFT